MTKGTWNPSVGIEDEAEVMEEQQFHKRFTNCFAFSLHDLGVLKGQEVQISLTNDAQIYCKPYK